MARIANKKTGKLTKRYREVGVYHANTRRRSYHSYRRKSSFVGKNLEYVDFNDPKFNAFSDAMLFVIATVMLMAISPIFLPFPLGGALLYRVNKKCKAVWNIPSGPASGWWSFLTVMEMFFSFAIAVGVAVKEIDVAILFVNLIIYAALSIWILLRKHKKIIKQSNLEKKEERAVEETETAVNKSTKETKRFRIGWAILAVFFLIYAAIFVLLAVEDVAFFYATAFFGIFAIMFFVLALSPKEKPRIFGFEKGISKKAFVIICILAALIMPILGI